MVETPNTDFEGREKEALLAKQKQSLKALSEGAEVNNDVLRAMRRSIQNIMDRLKKTQEDFGLKKWRKLEAKVDDKTTLFVEFQGAESEGVHHYYVDFGEVIGRRADSKKKQLKEPDHGYTFYVRIDQPRAMLTPVEFERGKSQPRKDEKAQILRTVEDIERAETQVLAHIEAIREMLKNQ